MDIGLAIIAALSFHLVGYLPVIISQWTALNLKNALDDQFHESCQLS